MATRLSGRRSRCLILPYAASVAIASLPRWSHSISRRQIPLDCSQTQVSGLHRTSAAATAAAAPAPRLWIDLSDTARRSDTTTVLTPDLGAMQSPTEAGGLPADVAVARR